MATELQEKATERLVENRGNVSKSMREAGYANKTAKNPRNLTESVGYKELLKENGLTEKLITKALVEDIKAKKKNRYSELSLGADLLGMKKNNEGGGNKTLILIVSNESANRYGVNSTRNSSSSSE